MVDKRNRNLWLNAERKGGRILREMAEGANGLEAALRRGKSSRS
jgi:hypothetical protein